ncbi:MAG TPA: hypothetical protein PLT76_08765 [Candidatus Omnitrophota bacterium]|nr:hypothetical protein [Candidatus Omnitrophota bacterium]HPB68443.1 hypothetical protein [Candidatus Omnitrophota bacterium]HQO58794.1 hypothetical protein [Candidatus Omnitrophota bacterium]HQP11369.1 hypothetical protein [Candidatus Omnitrophota bacterium]
MGIFRLIKTAQPEANLLAIAALVLLLLKILILNRVSEFFPGAHDIGLVVEATLASVIASYVFYIFVVHMKESSDRREVQPYIRRHVDRVVGQCRSQLRDISKKSGIEISLENASPELITSAFTKIAPYSDAPLVISPTGTYANWLQYFYYAANQTHESVSRVLAQLLYIEAELVSLLTAVNDCSHFHALKIFQIMKVNNTDLTAWASCFAEYCDLCKKLNSYQQQCLA